MKLLDELDEEAARLRAERDAAAKRQSEVEQVFQSLLLPGIERLEEFLNRLSANLKLLKPAIVMRYAVPGYGEIRARAEHDYVIELARHPSSRTLNLTFSCLVASQECPLVEVQGSARVRSLAGVFHRHRIAGMSTPQKDASGEVVSAGFRARGRIAQRAQFHVDVENPQLRMSFENIDGLGTTMKTVPADRLDDALFDQIGRYLMGEPNSLFREELPEAYRRQLRQKVQHEQLRRRWESHVSQAVSRPDDKPASAEPPDRSRTRLRSLAADWSAALRTRLEGLLVRARRVLRR